MTQKNITIRMDEAQVNELKKAYGQISTAVQLIVEPFNKMKGEKIFDEAIEKGILSTGKDAPNFAGNFMYMYSENEVHYFKHIITRKYGSDLESVIKACEFY